MPDAKQTIWAGVSRAVRVPARLDTDLRFFPVPGLLAIAGNPDFRPEELLAFEIGYRIALHSKILFDASPFFHSYDSLITLEPGLPGQPATIGNGMNAETSGLSFRTHADPYSWLRLTGSITFLHKDLELDADSRDLSNAAGEGNDPDHFWQMQAMIDPREDIQLDFILRSSGELPSPVVPGYVELDLRFAWFPQKNLELSLTAQNLVHDQHPEFGAPNPDRREVQRGVYGKFAWFF